MSLVGYKAQNHRQQVARRGARPEIDERATTPEVFGPLDAEFGFTIDVAALPRNAKCERFWTPDDDGLERDWAGEVVWCNPPHSLIEPWVVKAWEQADRARAIVMLVPANRTEQGWWQRWIEPYRDRGVRAGPADAVLSVRFLRGRLRFIAFDADEVKPNERPPYGCALLVWHANQEGRR